MRNEKFLLETLRDFALRNSTSLENTCRSLTTEILPMYCKCPGCTVTGPGTTLGVGFIFVLTGAEKYYGLEIYMDPDLFAVAQYESIAYLLQLASGEKPLRKVGAVMTVKDGEVEFAKERLDYLYPRQSYDIPLPDRLLDQCFLTLHLEHVADPRAIRRVLRKGGITAHQIDMRDHADFSKPLEFLKVDEHTWNEQWKDPTRAAWYLNRWRLCEFKAAFERYGFHIFKLDVNATFPVEECLRRTLDTRFREIQH